MKNKVFRKQIKSAVAYNIIIIILFLMLFLILFDEGKEAMLMLIVS